MDDAAQAWLTTHDDGRPTGSYAHFAVFCLYKAVGLPEGAVSVGPEAPSHRPLDPRPGAWQLMRRHAWWLVARSRLASVTVKLLWRPRQGGFDPEAEFGLRDPDAMPWATTCYLTRRLADPAAAERRRANYARLLGQLGNRVPPPFNRLPPGASPFVFPLQTEDKAYDLERLRLSGVIGLDVWGHPHPLLPVERFPEIARRRARTIGLPIHQELRTDDLDRMAAEVRAE